ncbi:hypothetical protein D3C78_874630 [compost metagenome]
MHGAAGNLHAAVDGALMGVQAGEKRQQGRVDIDDAAFIGGNEIPRYQAHVTGKADDIRRNLAKCGQYGALMLRLAGISLAFEDQRRNTEIPCLFQPARRCLVRNHADDFRRKIHRLAGLGQRHHVGAAAGNENDDAFAAGREGGAHHRPRVPL